VSANGVPVWVVKVGSQNNDLTFSPSTIQAKPGEMILQQQTDILGRIIPSPHLPSMRLACHS
jgi:plastocyanin